MSRIWGFKLFEVIAVTHVVIRGVWQKFQAFWMRVLLFIRSKTVRLDRLQGEKCLPESRFGVTQPNLRLS
jgi:hypothetical protein